MRWYVNVKPGSQGQAAEQWVVEAGHWQPALLAARKLRGEPMTLEGFAVELMDDGWRAVDPSTYARYLVRSAPDEEPLTMGRARSIPPSALASIPPRPPRPQGAGPSQPPPRPKSVPPAAPAPDGTAFDLVRHAPPPAPASVATEPQLLHQRQEDPTESSPLTYRESAWYLPGGTSPDAAVEVLRTLFDRVRASLESVPRGKLVNIAVFDHPFEKKPARPPLASLTWKDWKSDEPQIRKAGEVVASVPPASAPSSPYSVVPAPKAVWTSAAAMPAAVAPTPANAVPAGPAVAPTPANAVPAVAPTPAVAAPSRPVAANVQPVLPVVPVSQPSRPVVRLKGDDLIADLFEAMHDLHFAADSLVAAEFVLNLALEKMPSRVALVHFFDIDAREFVVVRAKGRSAENVMGHRTPERDPVIVEAMRKAQAVIVNQAPTEQRLRAERFAKLGYECRSLIAGPVEQGGRFLGLLELCNPRDGGVYSEGDGHALTYLGEQFAGYLAERGVILDPERIRSR
jgi:hypothetical protein